MYTYIYKVYVKLLILLYACTCPLYFLCILNDFLAFFGFGLYYTLVKDFGHTILQLADLWRLLDTWDRNRSTSGLTPWQIYDDKFKL
jgi:hypothetical protein